MKNIEGLLEVLADAMSEARDLIDCYVDVKDGDYGQQIPNNAMRATQLLDAAIAKANREINKAAWLSRSEVTP